jgi:hypothetical protein
VSKAPCDSPKVVKPEVIPQGSCLLRPSVRWERVSVRNAPQSSFLRFTHCMIDNAPAYTPGLSACPQYFTLIALSSFIHVSYDCCSDCYQIGLDFALLLYLY